MYLKKNLMIIALLLGLVLSLSAVGNNAISNVSSGPGVDQIYQQIRNSELKYDVEERTITFSNEGMLLVGTLALPKVNKRCPIVITLNGFAGVRNEEFIPGTNNDTVFGRTARILAGHGIASLRVDFRGSGESEGSYDMTCFSGQMSDVLATVDYICKDLKYNVDTNSIGIIGFSQGGLVGILTAAKDTRVDSLVLWSAPANPTFNYSQIITDDIIKQGARLGNSEVLNAPIIIEGVIWFYLPLGKRFFDDLVGINPVAEVQKYKKPLMCISGLKDNIVWPQPGSGEVFLKYHEGEHKLVKINADHEFNYWDGPIAEKLTDAIYWSAAWLIKTLKHGTK